MNFKLFAAAALALAVHLPSQAGPLLLTFTATNFQQTGGLAVAPQSLVEGSIVFEAPDTKSYPTLISMINLSIDGHTYTAAEVGGTLLNGAYQVPGVNVGYIFGGRLDDVNIVGSGRDDFFIQITDFLDPNCPSISCYAPKIGYSSRNSAAIPDTIYATKFWLTSDLTWTLTPYVAPSDPPGHTVPEPNSAWLGLIGLVALLAYRLMRSNSMPLSA